MKIGILTFHCAHNYGAVLQAFGLQEFLKQIGHDPYIINYTPSYLLNGYQKFSKFYWIDKNILKLLKKLQTEPFIFIQRYFRWKAFNKFIYCRMRLCPYDNHNDFLFDAIIIGSDQVWNSKISNGCFDDVYFGINANCKIIAYAASSRSKELNKYEKDYYKQHLGKFAAIGVRENSLKKLLQPLVDTPIQVTLDPTLLAGVKVFDKIASCVKPNKYILLYEVEEHVETYKITKLLANQLNATIIELVAPLSVKRLLKKKQTASPEEFLGYIKNAACIITSSFHGVALSVLFNRPFYALRQNTNADLRTESLLELLKLTDRFINFNSSPLFSEIDYNRVNHLLNVEREKSVSFLKKALG